MLRQHLNQPLVITDIGRSAMGEKGKAQRIDEQMPLDAIGTFVAAESLRSFLGVTGVIDCLRVANQ
jgi:hypothetical protein